MEGYFPIRVFFLEEILGSTTGWSADSGILSVWYNLHSVLKVSQSSSPIRSLFLGKTAVKTFGKAEVIICARLEIPTKEPLTFLFYGLINAEFCMKELNGSILFKYSVVFRYTFNFSFSSISRVEGKKSSFAFVPIWIFYGSWQYSYQLFEPTFANIAHFSPSFLLVRYFDFTNFAITFHSMPPFPHTKYESMAS